MQTTSQILEAAQAAAKAAEHLAKAWTTAETGDAAVAMEHADAAQTALRNALRRLPQGREALEARAITKQAAPTGEPPQHRTQRELLKVAIQHPGLVPPHFRTLTPDEFTNPEYARLRAAITAERSGEDDGGWVSACSEHVDDDTRALYTELAEEQIFRKSVDQRYADEHVVNVRRASLDRKIKEVREGLPLKPDEETQASLWAMQQYARALRERGAAALGEHPEALAYLHDRPGPDA